MLICYCSPGQLTSAPRTMVEICHVCKTGTESGRHLSWLPNNVTTQVEENVHFIENTYTPCVCKDESPLELKILIYIKLRMCWDFFAKEVWTHICASQIGHWQQTEETAYPSLAWCSNESTGVTLGAGRRGCLQEHWRQLTNAASLDSLHKLQAM